MGRGGGCCRRVQEDVGGGRHAGGGGRLAAAACNPTARKSRLHATSLHLAGGRLTEAGGSHLLSPGPVPRPGHGHKVGTQDHEAPLSTLRPERTPLTDRVPSPKLETIWGSHSGQLCPPSGLGPGPGSLETPWPGHPGCPQHHGLALPCKALEVCGVGGGSRPQHWTLPGPCLSFPICELGIRAAPLSWVFEDGVTRCACPSRFGPTPDLVPIGSLSVSLCPRGVLPGQSVVRSGCSRREGTRGLGVRHRAPLPFITARAFCPAEPAPRRPR